MQLCVMTEIQLALMKEKMTAHKYFRQNGNSDFWQHSLKFLQDHLNNSIKFPEGKYYNGMVSKLQNTKESSKSYQFLLSIFSKDKKIPLLPPYFCSNHFVSDVKQKPDLFNPKLSGCLKLVTIVLETWNLVHGYTNICSFSTYTFLFQDSLNFAVASIFWQNWYLHSKQ